MTKDFSEEIKETIALSFYNHCRPEVRSFAIEMEKTLQRNDHKGGWQNESLEWLMIKLMEEVGELAVLIHSSSIHLSDKAVTGEATDVANLAMMISDRAQNILADEDNKKGE